MKINGFDMDWLVFLETCNGTIDEFDPTNRYNALLISGTKMDSDGKEITWAGYWDIDSNGIDIYDDGTTAPEDEAWTMKFLVEHLLSTVAEKVPYFSDDVDEYDVEAVHAFLHALTDRLNGDEELNDITTDHIYVVKENHENDVFTSVTTSKEEAMDRLYNAEDKNIGDITVSEVIGLKINNPSIIESLGYDGADEIAGKFLNESYFWITPAARARFSAGIQKADIVDRKYRSDSPAKSTYYYVDDIDGKVLSCVYSTASDRDLIKKAKDTLDVARCQLSENETVSELCFDASTVDIRSDDDLKRMLSQFPAIEDALREAGYDDTADELKTLNARIYSEFKLA